MQSKVDIWTSNEWFSSETSNNLIVWKFPLIYELLSWLSYTRISCFSLNIAYSVVYDIVGSALRWCVMSQIEILGVLNGYLVLPEHAQLLDESLKSAESPQNSRFWAFWNNYPIKMLKTWNFGISVCNGKITDRGNTVIR